jgi:hypothetical protein
MTRIFYLTLTQVDLMAKKALHTFEIHPFKGFDVPEYDQVYPTNRWHKMFEGLTFGRPWNAAVMLEFGRFSLSLSLLHSFL